MAENEDFLKKVYDRYLGSDYEWGDADLNPKREIQKSDEEEWEEEQAAIIATVEARLKELQRQAAQLPKYKRPEVVDNDDFLTTTSGVNGAPSPSKDLSLNQIATQAALGGDIGDNLFIPSANFDDQINFMLNTVIPSLIPVLVEMPGGPNTAPNGVSFATELFNPGCDTEGNTISDFELSDFESSSGSINDDNRNDVLSDEAIQSLATSGAASNQADKEADTADAAAEKAAQEKYTLAVECIAKELGILQYILALLKVVNTIKKVVLLILSIIVPIVKIIAFAAQCWINPPAAAQVLQMVAEKIAALLVSVIGEILQMIWNMLELDCKTQQTQKLLDEINSILSGIDSTINTTKNLISFTVKQYKTNKDSLIDSYNKFFVEDEDGNRKLRLGQFGEEYFDIEKWKEAGEVFSDTLATKMFGQDGVDEEGVNLEGIKTMISSGMPSEIKNTINNLLNSSTDLLGNAKNVFESAGLNDTVLQATLTDMTDFLGPIKIK